MLSEIINTYEQFSDSLILKVCYISLTENSSNSRTIEVVIRCMNKLNDYEWDVIKLSFLDVIKFRFIENENTSSTLINSALLKREDGNVIVDFFPLYYSQSSLLENPNSDFIIYCKDLKYEVIK
ncbi:hypothetical protein [Spirosoma foliorum]|uniref:Uncharacterized protein n=1 Tax=Spirosoma foliorum TaxID=2710596 RepID=A0A7G5GVG2_9BACT|nr:hypothetical protein [Spirosoma foliorum]QMW02854.1 hypothetical protein H3H32_34015 [Spirosoma foliorum]